MEKINYLPLGAQICVYFGGCRETHKTIYFANKRMEDESTHLFNFSKSTKGRFRKTTSKPLHSIAKLNYAFLRVYFSKIECFESKILHIYVYMT